MTKVKHFAHVLLDAAYQCCASRLSAGLNQKPAIIKTSYDGSDLKLWLSDGRILLISAIESENTGKPYLDFEFSGDLTPEKAVVA